MNKRSYGFVLAIASLGIGGCTTLGAFQLTSGTGRLEVRPELVTGGYRAQALVEPWAPEDVEHVEVRLLTLSESGDEAPTLVNGKAVVQDLAGTALTNPLSFMGLLPHTLYRVRARAFKAQGSETASLISDDALSYVDIRTLADDRPSVATLSIRLLDVPFDGQATGSVEIVPGSVVPTGTERMQLGAPDME